MLLFLLVSMSSFVSADVIINEIMYNPNQCSSESFCEWVELFNNGSEAVNLNEWELEESPFDNVTIQPGQYIVVSHVANVSDGGESFESYWGNNDSVWNSTDGSYNLSDGNFGTGFSNTGEIINLSDGTITQFTVDYTDFISLANDNGKTLVFYKGNFTESAFVNGSPGASNDQFAPDFNKWVVPSNNNSFANGLFNITVNITDVTNVSSVIVDFNGTNFTMQQGENIWHYVLNTTKYQDGLYNLTAYFNDTNNFSNSDILYNLTVDNTNPGVVAPSTSTNSRNYANPGFNINASVNVTDLNLLNVTCTLGSTTVDNFSNDGNTYFCNLTTILAQETLTNKEQDFQINISAIDKSGNSNHTTINFTTKYSTSATLRANSVSVSGLNQSNKIIQVNATLNNTGSNRIYDAGIEIVGFSSTSLSSTNTEYQSCSSELNNSQTCNLTFNITVAGATIPGNYNILWNANWTDNNFSKRDFSNVRTSSITVDSNPQITATANSSKLINHGQESTISFDINSTGNVDLSDVNITFIQGTLKSEWLNLTSLNIPVISKDSGIEIVLNASIPKYTNPNNYTGIFNITSSNTGNKEVLITVEVPTDNFWTSAPNATTKYVKSVSSGLAAKFVINNSGNIGHNFSIYPPSGNFFFYNLWSDSNIRDIYIEAGKSSEISINHNQISGNAPQTIGSFNLTITITSQNTSNTNKTLLSLVRDDNNPGINITSPINGTFVNGDVDFNVSSSDLNLSRIEFYINKNLVLNDINLSKTFNWSTANGSYPDDVYELKSIAYDSAGNSNFSMVNVTVNNTDDAPILIKNIPTINLIEDNDSTILNLSFYFKTLDGDNLKYNFTQPDNVTVHVNNDTQIANFSPAPDFAGINYITFTAIDSNSNTQSSNNVTINVLNVNDAPSSPVLNSPISGSNVTSSIGKATLRWSNSVDADGDTITYKVYISNDSNNIRLNSTTTINSVELNGLQNNVTFYWQVSATDGTLDSANTTKFNFTMLRDNTPVLNRWTWDNTINTSSTNASPIVAENKTLSFTINASDPDNDTINFTWYIDSIEKSNVQNFTYNLTDNFTAEGSHTLMLEVQDNNSNSVSQIWQVSVTDTNREPVLDLIPNQEALEDSELKFNITAIDPDNNTLTFTSNISSISFSKDSNNSLATVSWTPANGDVGNKSIRIIVRDGSKNDSRIFLIQVNNTNDAPIISSFLPSANKTIAEGAGVQRFEANFSDIDEGDYLNATWYRNTTLITFNSSNITVTGLNVGEYNITVIVADVVGAEARYTWKLVVTSGIIFDGLTSSSLTGLNQTQRENVSNVAINHSTLGGIDFGNNTMNFSRVATLEDAINISGGLVSINTDLYPELKGKSGFVVMKGLNFTKAPLIYRADGFISTQAGIICNNETCTSISFDKESGILRFRAANFSTYFTQVNATNGEPVITSSPVTQTVERASYMYDVEAVDPDGDTLIFSLIDKPSGMVISNSTGLITWSPKNSDLGIHNVTINVSDSNLTTIQKFNLTVSKGPKLIISDLDIKVDSKTDKNIRNGSKISKDAAPGSKVEFKLELENLFTKDEDLDIDNIDVDIIIEDIDDGDDLEEDSSDIKIKADDKEKITFKFEVPVEVDEDVYDVFIFVEGDDDNGTTHELMWKLGLEVEKENHEIRILRALSSPNSVSCQRTVSLSTEIINTGSKDEDDVSLEITSLQLGIDSATHEIELDEGTDNNRFTKTISKTISPDIEPGTYVVDVRAFYDGKLSESKDIVIDVNECEFSRDINEPVKEDKPLVEVLRPAVTISPNTQDTLIQDSFTESSGYNMIMAILVILFIGTAIFVIGAGTILLRK
jgi:hypothetical protein